MMSTTAAAAGRNVRFPTARANVTAERAVLIAVIPVTPVMAPLAARIYRTVR